MSRLITHKGIITKASNHTVTLRLNASASECNACAIASLCSKPAYLTLGFENASADLIGKTAVVASTNKSQQYAILMFLTIPLAILITSILIALQLGFSQSIVGLSAIATMSVWYLALYMLRIRINKKAEFKITDIL